MRCFVVEVHLPKSCEYDNVSKHNSPLISLVTADKECSVELRIRAPHGLLLPKSPAVNGASVRDILPRSQGNLAKYSSDFSHVIFKHVSPSCISFTGETLLTSAKAFSDIHFELATNTLILISGF